MQGPSSCPLSHGLYLVASNRNLQPPEYLRVQGKGAPDTKSFVLNLGKDSNNVCLHFNSRTDIHGDTNTTACSSKDGGAQGTEQWKYASPCRPRSVTELCISFDQADLIIKLSDEYTFKFPNRLDLEAINYLAAEGDFKSKSVAFE